VSCPAPDTIPRLAPGCRLREMPGQPAMLLVPEGALKLTGSSLSIVNRIDGVSSFARIVGELRAEFPDAEAAAIEEQAAAFLEKLNARGVVRFA
jgi:pyrroloquinoline quinone biosynthesis protein D